MNKHPKYTVKLSDRERQYIKNITRKGDRNARVMKRASVLLNSDAGKTDGDIADTLAVSTRTIERVRIRYGTEGIERALYDAPRSGKPPTITDKVEARLVAIACSSPPEGTIHWTLDLLQEKMIKDGIVDSIGRSAIHLHLHDRGIKPWREKNVGDTISHSRVH